MPQANKKSASKTQKTTKNKKLEDISFTDKTTPKSSKGKSFSFSTITSYRPSKLGWVIIVVIGALILLSFKKGIFLAATVNGAPITNFELLSRLNQQYRTQTINQMVNEKIITEEARKKGVIIGNNEINERISQLESNVGGAQALDNLLVQQGQTRDSLKDQLKVQLTIEKLYASEATVSAEEVSQFIAENADSLQATSSAEQTEEATNILKQQKLGKAFNEKFQELKTSAKVQIF